MWRRLRYLVIGVVTVDVVLMLGMYLDLRMDNDCDTGSRGLVVWSDQSQRWETWRVAPKDSGPPPCRGEVHGELRLLPD